MAKLNKSHMNNRKKLINNGKLNNYNDYPSENNEPNINDLLY